MEEMKFNLTPTELKAAEKSVYSQGGQDGVLEAIFNQIGHGSKLFYECGARDGIELSNTANLRLNHNWQGLLEDSDPKSGIVHKDQLLRANINYILTISFGFSSGISLFSLDIDGNDYWIWEEAKMAIASQNPRVVLIEYNSKFRNNESFVIEYNPEHKWEGDDYYGASLFALKKLGERKGYTLVYVVDRFDAVFIRNDLVSPDYIIPTLDELLPEPIIAHEKKSTKKWVIV